MEKEIRDMYLERAETQGIMFTQHMSLRTLIQEVHEHERRPKNHHSVNDPKLLFIRSGVAHELRG